MAAVYFFSLTKSTSLQMAMLTESINQLINHKILTCPFL